MDVFANMVKSEQATPWWAFAFVAVGMLLLVLGGDDESRWAGAMTVLEIALDGEPVYGWGGAAVATSLAAYGARRAQRPDGLILSPAGVERPFRETVAWEAMTIVAHNDGDLIIRSERGDPIELPAAYLPLEPEEIVALVETYRDQPERRAAIGTEAELLRWQL